GGYAAEAVRAPRAPPHPAVDARREERDAEGRPRPRKWLGPRVLDTVFGFGQRPLDVGEVGDEAVGLADLLQRQLIAVAEERGETGVPGDVERALPRVLDRRVCEEFQNVPGRGPEGEDLDDRGAGGRERDERHHTGHSHGVWNRRHTRL